MNGGLLVFGASGQVGRETMALAATRGIPAIGLAREEADIRDAGAVRDAVARAKPRLIVNAAAYTAVDRAEREAERAFAINADGAACVAKTAAAYGIPLLHLSTDFVFDGTKCGAYDENDPIAPLGVYGHSKAAGEAAVRDMAARHVIVRTSWVYGIYGANFLKTILNLATKGDPLRVVADQEGCPTATIDIAEAILAVDARLAIPSSCAGTFHFAGTGVTTWHGFAQAVVDAQAEMTGRRPPVAAIATADYPTAAVRPTNSALDSRRFSVAFGYEAPAWPTRVRETVASLLTRSDATKEKDQ